MPNFILNIEGMEPQTGFLPDIDNNRPPLAYVLTNYELTGMSRATQTNRSFNETPGLPDTCKLINTERIV